MNTTGRVALVVGGSGGIGGSASLALAEAGFDVAVHYFKNINAARNVVAAITEMGRKANVFRCDVGDQTSVVEMVTEINQRLGPISVIVNCATEKIVAIKFSDLIWNDIELHFNNQIKGAFNLVKAIVPQMKNMGYGKIINIDTQYVDAPEANLLPYITAKSALRGFSRSLALDLAPSGIRVNTVSPGMTDTDLLANVPERVRLVTAAKTPLRRLANAEDIAKAIVFLASNQSDFLCGETMRINGGQVML
jgi:3-oxoacyl-[acyl-carrier protein] reductase